MFDIKSLFKKKQVDPEEQRHAVADWAMNILILLFGTTTLVQAFVVPTASMESTIMIGDHMFVDKLAYSPSSGIGKMLLPYQEVKRGDVIVFRYPLNISMNYVKRVIGIPGDHLKIVDKTVHINGKPLDEKYKQHVLKRESGSIPYLDNFPMDPSLVPYRIYDRAREMLRDNIKDGELIVPPGSYFAMGDNRDNSEDSRFWGFVPRENIVGKPIFVWWSYNAPTSDWVSWDLSHFIDVGINFFSKTRWDRTPSFVRPVPIGGEPQR